MIIGKLFLSAVDGFTFLGAQHLLTVGRPEGLVANLADLLTKGVLALFSKAFLLFFCLLMGFCTVGVTKPLPCTVRIKLLTALFADTLRVLMTVIRRQYGQRTLLFAPASPESPILGSQGCPAPPSISSSGTCTAFRAADLK